MSYSCNDNQNYFVQGGKTTSRVLKQPGGGSSISLGWDTGADEQNIRPERVNARQASNEVTAKIGSAIQGPEGVAAPTGYAYGRPDNGYSGGAGSTSSNAYANGSNQNCGNMITDRSSTRIHAPPGGGSSFSLGWDAAAPASAPAPVRAPAPVPVSQPEAPQAAFGNDRHSYKNRMQSSNITFGYEDTQQSNNSNNYDGRQQRVSNDSDRFQTTSQAASQMHAVAAPTGYTNGRPQNGYSGGAGSTSSNAYANGSNQNCGNMITDRSSTRIHAPPGGVSSITFG